MLIYVNDIEKKFLIYVNNDYLHKLKFFFKIFLIFFFDYLIIEEKKF